MRTDVPAPRDPIERGLALHARAQELRDAGDPLAARRRCEKALELLSRALGPRHPDVANVLLELSATYLDRGDTARAIPLCERALTILARVRCGLDGDRLRFAALAQHGGLLLAAGRYREARAAWSRALRLADRKLGSAERRTAHGGLGVACKHLGRLDEAEAHYREALASLGRARRPLDLATLYHNLGGLEHARGRFARGAALARRGLRLREAALGPKHVDVAADKAALASLLVGKGDLDAAEALYQEAIAVFRRAYGPRHFEVGFNLGNLAAVAHQRGDLAEAARRYARALAIQEAAAGPAHTSLALLLENFATLRRAQGRVAEAAALCRRAVAVYTRALGARHPDTRAARRALGAKSPGRPARPTRSARPRPPMPSPSSRRRLRS
jgi:tetratricopeptide (TPR) repeat protein